MQLVLALLAACSPSTSTFGPIGPGEGMDGPSTDTAGGDTGETGDPGPTETIPDIPIGSCGADYDWVPLEQVGQVVEVEAAKEWWLSKEVISAAMSSYGLGAYAPVPYDVMVWRIRYTTQDRGEQVEATGLVSVPVVEEPTTVPTMLSMHPTMGFIGACAPSAGSLEGVAFNVLFSSMGWAVATPDYLGMNGWGEESDFLHPYVVAEPTAIAGLDALKALHAFAATEGLDATPDPDTTLFWGASEGGFGALWADRYAPFYAPDFHVIGTVAAVPPTDLVGLAQVALSSVNNTTWALAAGLVTSNAWFGNPVPLDELMTDEDPTWYATTIPERLSSSCSIATDHIDSVDELFRAEVVDAFLAGEEVEPVTCYTETSSLTNQDIPREVDTPVFIVVAQNDDLVAAAPTRASIPDLCDMGYRIEYLECAGAGHVDGAFDSVAEQFAWILDRLDGVPLEDECVVGEPVECSGL